MEGWQRNGIELLFLILPWSSPGSSQEPLFNISRSCGSVLQAGGSVVKMGKAVFCLVGLIPVLLSAPASTAEPNIQPR